MNIGSSLSSAIAELGSQTATPAATAAATSTAAPSVAQGMMAVSASSSLLMKVADETVSADNNSIGSVDAWA
jgi:hypothetical protein